MSPRRSDYPTARVSILLRDGRTLEETTTVVRGDAENPVQSEDVVAKFLALASPVLGASRARRAADAVNEVDMLKSVQDLTSLLTTE